MIYRIEKQFYSIEFSSDIEFVRMEVDSMENMISHWKYDKILYLNISTGEWISLKIIN